MIDVRVGQYHAVDFFGIDRGWLPIAQAKLLQSLEEPAVDQDPLAPGGNQVFRAGDGVGGAEELNSHLGQGRRVLRPKGYTI